VQIGPSSTTNFWIYQFKRTSLRTLISILESVHTLRSLTAVPYLVAITVGVVGGRFLDYLTYMKPMWFGQTLGLTFQISCTMIAMLLWLATREYERLKGLSLLLFGALILLWLLVTIRARLDQSAFNYSAITTPIVLAMIILKAPRSSAAWRSADIAFASLALAVVLSQALDFTGLREARQAPALVTRWPLFDLDFLPAYRWEGPFQDPNNAGLIGAMLVVYAMHRNGQLRNCLLIVGLPVVVFSESRTAIIALAVGLVISLATSRQYVSRQRSRTFTTAIVLSLIATVVAIVWIFDPTLNGRVGIWKAFANLTASEPLLGVGWSGIDLAARTSQIPWQNVDGHNLVIDASARHGLITGLLVLAVLSAAALLALRARHNDGGTSLSVLSVWLLGALTYTVTTWQYLGILMLPLLSALLIGTSCRTARPTCHP